MDLAIVWEDTRLWSRHTKGHGQDIEDVLKYCSEKIPLITQVDQIETKRHLGMAQGTLYLAEFCLKMHRAWQATRHLTLRVQEYYQLYKSNYGRMEQNWGFEDLNSWCNSHSCPQHPWLLGPPISYDTKLQDTTKSPSSYIIWTYEKFRRWGVAAQKQKHRQH